MIVKLALCAIAFCRKDGGHRALGDIEDSIEELKYYRKTVFKQ